MDYDNKKKILCKNIVEKKICKYRNYCNYAHSLDEQLMSNTRHKVYDMITRKNDLSTIDLVHDISLFTTMKELTKVCLDCSNNKCVGGYNCRFGATSISTTICHADLMRGNCSNSFCKYVHLTKKKLIPYYTQKQAQGRYTQSPPIKISATNKIVDFSFTQKTYTTHTNNILCDLSDYDSDGSDFSAFSDVSDECNSDDITELCDTYFTKNAKYDFNITIFD